MHPGVLDVKARRIRVEDQMPPIASVLQWAIRDEGQLTLKHRHRHPPVIIPMSGKGQVENTRMPRRLQGRRSDSFCSWQARIRLDDHCCPFTQHLSGRTSSPNLGQNNLLHHQFP
jgi:hypothetical protein